MTSYGQNAQAPTVARWRSWEPGRSRLDTLSSILIGESNIHQSHQRYKPLRAHQQPQERRNSASRLDTSEQHASAQEEISPLRWQLIQEWNNSPSRPHSQKVAISATTLERRFGIYRPATQQFVADHQADIEAHAQAHGITAPTHNRGVPDQVWEMLKERGTEGKS